MTYKLAIYHNPHDFSEPYRVAIISPGKKPERAAGADVCEVVMVIDLDVDRLPPIAADEVLTAPGTLHESAAIFGLMADVPSYDDPELMRQHGKEDDELMARRLDEAYLDRIPDDNPEGKRRDEI